MKPTFTYCYNCKGSGSERYQPCSGLKIMDYFEETKEWRMMCHTCLMAHEWKWFDIFGTKAKLRNP